MLIEWNDETIVSSFNDTINWINARNSFIINANRSMMNVYSIWLDCVARVASRCSAFALFNRVDWPHKSNKKWIFAHRINKNRVYSPRFAIKTLRACPSPCPLSADDSRCVLFLVVKNVRRINQRKKNENKNDDDNDYDRFRFDALAKRERECR